MVRKSATSVLNIKNQKMKTENTSQKKCTHQQQYKNKQENLQATRLRN